MSTKKMIPFKVGNVYRHPDRNWLFLVLEPLGSKNFKMVWLPSSWDPEGGNKVGTIGKAEYYEDEYEELTNYQIPGALCEDCRAFCKQRCHSGPVIKIYKYEE